ncbi:MAG: hypothetical protein ACM3XM_20380 [Mycobacterium leprae]
MAVPFSIEELLRERREGSVRALIRVIGYALARGQKADEVGRFLFDSYRLAGEFEQQKQCNEADRVHAFMAWHMRLRWGWCDDVRIAADQGAYVLESASALNGQAQVLGFHGISRLDVENCLEQFWQNAAAAVGLEATYTIGEDRDWTVIRTPAGAALALDRPEFPMFTPQSLAEHRRLQLATWISASVGFAKHCGDESEDFGHYFYTVWDRSGHYDRLRNRWGYGNALAYAQSLVLSRQVLYRATELGEDLDGYTVSSPSWATEIPHALGTFGTLPDDIYRYYEGGGVPACAKLGLQYADQSDDRTHRVWVRAR